MSRSSIWSRKVLIPCWTLQIFCMICLIVLYSFLTGAVISGRYVASGSIVLMVFFGAWIALDIVQIVLYHKHRLSPLAMLIMQCVTSTFWLVRWIISMVTLAIVNDWLNFIIVTIPALSFFMTLIYSSVVFDHQRKRKASETHELHGDIDGDGILLVPKQTV